MRKNVCGIDAVFMSAIVVVLSDVDERESDIAFRPPHDCSWSYRSVVTPACVACALGRGVGTRAGRRHSGEGSSAGRDARREGGDFRGQNTFEDQFAQSSTDIRGDRQTDRSEPTGDEQPVETFDFADDRLTI